MSSTNVWVQCSDGPLLRGSDISALGMEKNDSTVLAYTPVFPGGVRVATAVSPDKAYELLLDVAEYVSADSAKPIFGSFSEGSIVHNDL